MKCVRSISVVVTFLLLSILLTIPNYDNEDIVKGAIVGEYRGDEPNLRALYHFSSGSLNDASSYNNDGTYTNVNIINGKFQYAASFNGATSYAQAPHNSALNIDAPCTVELWINPQNPLTDDDFLVGKDGAWEVYLHANDLRWRYTDTTGAEKEETAVDVIQQGIWQKISVEFFAVNGAYAVYMYRNDVMVWSDSLVNNIRTTSTRPITIGARETTGVYDRYYTGWIDEVAVFETRYEVGRTTNIMVTPTTYPIYQNTSTEFLIYSLGQFGGTNALMDVDILYDDGSGYVSVHSSTIQSGDGLYSFGYMFHDVGEYYFNVSLTDNSEVNDSYSFTLIPYEYLMMTQTIIINNQTYINHTYYSNSTNTSYYDYNWTNITNIEYNNYTNTTNITVFESGYNITYTNNTYVNITYVNSTYTNITYVNITNLNQTYEIDNHYYNITNLTVIYYVISIPEVKGCVFVPKYAYVDIPVWGMFCLAYSNVTDGMITVDVENFLTGELVDNGSYNLSTRDDDIICSDFQMVLPSTSVILDLFRVTVTVYNRTLSGNVMVGRYEGIIISLGNYLDIYCDLCDIQLYTLQFYEGWNFVSFPYDVDGVSFQAFFTAYPYVEAIAYKTNGDYSIILRDTSVDRIFFNGIGYYIYAYHNFTLDYKSCNVLINQTWVLNPGWNIVGTPYNVNVKFSHLDISNVSAIVAREDGGPYEWYFIENGDDPIISYGRAYYVYSEIAQTVTVDMNV